MSGAHRPGYNCGSVQCAECYPPKERPVTAPRWTIDDEGNLVCTTADDVALMVWIDGISESEIGDGVVALMRAVRDADKYRTALAIIRKTLAEPDRWEPDRYGHGSWWMHPGYRGDEVTDAERVVLADAEGDR